MRAGSTLAAAAAAGRGGRPTVRVDSYLGSQWLATLEVVKDSLQVSDSADDQVPGAVRFDVPNRARWRPVGPADPLAPFGQQVQVRMGWIYPGAEKPEWFTHGWFRISAPTDNGDTLSVEGVGRLTNVDQARLIVPFATSSTRMATVRRLLSGVIPFRFDGVVDEACPSAVFPDDRLAAVRDVVDAWPARLYVDDTGSAVIGKPFDDDNPGSPVVTWQRGGNLTAAPKASGDRPSPFNAYRVSTVEDGMNPVISEFVAQDTGPLRWGGPFGYRPGFFESPLLTRSRTALRTVGKMMLARSLARIQTYEVAVVPDYRVQVGDVARVVDATVSMDMVARVVAVTHSTSGLTATVAYLSGARGAA